MQLLLQNQSVMLLKGFAYKHSILKYNPLLFHVEYALNLLRRTDAKFTPFKELFKTTIIKILFFQML